MFKNRALQVKLVDTKKSVPEHVNKTDHDLEGKAAIVSYTAENIVKKVGVFVLGYVALDTLRQVLVAKASNH